MEYTCALYRDFESFVERNLHIMSSIQFGYFDPGDERQGPGKHIRAGMAIRHQAQGDTQGKIPSYMYITPT